MRMMLRWTVPVDKGNEMVNDGSMGTVLEELLGKLQPEAAYFFADGGERSGMAVFDMQDSSEIPGIAEILFQGSDAALEFKRGAVPVDPGLLLVEFFRIGGKGLVLRPGRRHVARGQVLQAFEQRFRPHLRQPVV